MTLRSVRLSTILDCEHECKTSNGFFHWYQREDIWSDAPTPPLASEGTATSEIVIHNTYESSFHLLAIYHFSVLACTQFPGTRHGSCNVLRGRMQARNGPRWRGEVRFQHERCALCSCMNFSSSRGPHAQCGLGLRHIGC